MYRQLSLTGLTVRPTYVNKGIDLISARELHKGFIEYEVAPGIFFLMIFNLFLIKENL